MNITKRAAASVFLISSICFSHLVFLQDAQAQKINSSFPSSGNEGKAYKKVKRAGTPLPEKSFSPQRKSLSSNGLSSPIDQVEDYQADHARNPLYVANKVDEMLESLNDLMMDLEQNKAFTPEFLLEDMMDIADATVSSTDQLYQEVEGMYKFVDSLYKTLDKNYASLDQYDAVTEDISHQFNQASDHLASQVKDLGQRLDKWVIKVQEDKSTLRQMLETVEVLIQRNQDSDTAVAESVKFVQSSSSQFKVLNAQLKSFDIQQKTNQKRVEVYFKSFNSYLKKYKDLPASDTKYLNEVLTYIQASLDYLNVVEDDITSSQNDLLSIEEYFFNATISPDGKNDMNQKEGPESGCHLADPKGMMSLKDCTTSCRGVCRWKKEVNGEECYECPSGSPDSCWDVGAWPENHPWCKAGGICYDDPMMYCLPFGTTGPQGENLKCTNCKKRNDMCWKHVQDGTTTLTNCKLGCWDGTCEYRGRYDQPEWDGKAEWIHCYECVTPPPPPSCEDLNWGYDFEEDCLDNCPDPGVCREVKEKMGDKNNQDNDEEQDKGGEGGEGGEGEGGGGKGGGQPAGGEPDKGGEDKGEETGEKEDGASGEGTKPTPPTTPPEQPGSGGGSAAGTPKEPVKEDLNPPSKTDTDKNQAPDKPSSTAPEQPEKDTPKRPKINKPEPPPTIEDIELGYLRTWLNTTKDIIKKKEDIIADPKEGTSVKTLAEDQRQEYEVEREKIESEIKEVEKKKADRIAKEEKRKQDALEYQRKIQSERKKTKTFEQLEREYDLKQLKNATDELKTRAQQIKEEIDGRKSRIEELDKDIALMEKEIKLREDELTGKGVDETWTKERIKTVKKRLNQIKANRAELQKKLKQKIEESTKELNKLKQKYKRSLWRANSTVREQAEVERIGEYLDLHTEKRRMKKKREVSDQVYKSKVREILEDISKAKKSEDDDKVDQLEDQLENMKRGKKEWDDTYNTQERFIDQQLENITDRNMFDGVGPDSEKELKEKIDKYATSMQNQIETLEKLKQQEEAVIKSGKVATSVDAQGNESTDRLDQINKRLEQLKASVQAIKAAQKELAEEYKLSDADEISIKRSTDRILEGSKNIQDGKTFTRLFAESLGEEMVNNLNPYTALKKALAFGVGTAKGVGSAVGGLLELGHGALDVVAESAAIAAGFEDGGIFGTEATETLSSVLNTASDNANLDGFIKAAVAAGGLIDKQLKKLEKSTDVDWASAELGGRVFGETVVGDAVVAGVVAKGAKVLKGADEVVDAAAAADKAGDAARAAGRGADASTSVKTGAIDNKIDDIAKIKEPDVGPAPRGSPNEGTPARRNQTNDSTTTKTDSPETPKRERAPPEDKTPPKKPDADTKRPDRDGLTAARTLDNTKPLPKNDGPVVDLPDDIAKHLETENGFRQDHAKRMHEFAQEHDTFLIVRDGNPDSVKYFGDADKMPKPMSSKAKTAKVGPDQGLVVDPTHPQQAKYWDEAISDAKKAGDTKKVEWLEKNRQKALDSWTDYGDYMQKNGYIVEESTGRILKQIENADGSITHKAVHGDYDLHGAYKRNPDGSVERASFGDGDTMQDGSVLRRQLNEKITAGDKDFIQHGAQDDWIPDPKMVPNKPPDPPAVVFFPDGRPPLQLKTAEDMKKFYQGEMGIKWEYPDAPRKPMDASAPKGADLDSPNGLKSGTGAAQAPPKDFKPSNNYQSNTEVNVLTQDGNALNLKTGDHLGSGSTSTVYVDAANPRQVIRFTEVGGDVAEAAKLDAVGRKTLETIQKEPGMSDTIRIAERYDSFAIQNSPGSQLNNHVVEINERLIQGTAKNVLAKQGGQMTSGQAKAFDRAVKELNDRGYAWLDNHEANYTFEKMAGSDQWRVVVVDAGGIVPMKGTTPKAKAANARAIQARVQQPSKELVEGLDMVKNNPQLQDLVAGEEYRAILAEHGKNIDIKAIGVSSVDDVAFRPTGAVNHPEVQKLFSK